MCGIVGYIGAKKALPVLLSGLKSLEYRGYDSAGVAVFSRGKVYTKKAVGRVSNLVEAIGTRLNEESNVGIAHTRWATHGGVTEANAHPHWDCEKRFFVVHNGIIENFKELSKELKDKGHKFRSETDTEVLPHLIEEIKKEKTEISLEEAVREALKKINGTYGIIVCDAREPNCLVAARNFSPMVLGVGEGEYILASDVSAILPFTKKVLYLHDGEIVNFNGYGYKISTIGREKVSRAAELLEGQDVVLATKGGHPHFMLKEIFEEPEAIRNSMRGRLDLKNGTAVLGGLKDVERQLIGAERIIISACGSAYLAGSVGKYLLEEFAQIPTDVEFASELRYRKPVFKKGDVFLAISQSGETADTLAALREAKKAGILTLGLVNVVGSTVSRETDAGVYQHIGPEIGVAATKSFISQVSILALISLFLGRERKLSKHAGIAFAKEVALIPEKIEKILAQKKEIEKLAKKYSRAEDFFFLGRKYNLPAALEGALKLKEIAYVHAEGYGAGELKHGPIALIDSEFPSVAIVTKDSVREKMMSNIHEIKARGGPVIAIASEGDREVAKVADDVIYIPKTLECLYPLLTVIPLQLFAYYFGVQRGLDVDKPRNLAKSVTVE
ncbi:MAG: glutamine--fructose-6-phosphate transaminase (isomerizing) [Candidatus Liptonbacteria bacterium]|nr:glutamine--fructose-6-phosphate transaminase (isomerizing) [Candidatus Liptonbacteria bacterium]